MTISCGFGHWHRYILQNRERWKENQKAKGEQVEIIAQVLDTDKNEFVTLWLADKVYDVVGDEINAKIYSML